ncbi:PD-(D/E)XK nuclease family protein [Cylindrospermopsis raciborskii G7]|uniref:PD-(D/E)XK nuclease family protein n=1 Tax=Cylindrospermopsis raciborskii TaxID=77022 RepID=UPI003EBA8F78
MIEAEIKALIQKELPRAIAEEPGVRDFVLRTVSEYYTPRTEFDEKFDRVLNELQRDREEQARKWDEQNRKFDAFQAEQAQKWDEQNRKFDAFQAEQAQKWDEQNRKWEENTQRLDRIEAQNSATLEEIQKANRRYESAIGAIGSRWGLYSEASFRNGLKAILGQSFGVEVLNLTLYDQEGEVFGRPEQVELDIIIKNGLTIVCELKSSIDKAGMYVFGRKAEFYAKNQNRVVDRKIVISPMVDERAIPVAKSLGIETYSYADMVVS